MATTADVEGAQRMARPRLRQRIVPRTVLGLATLILAFAVGAAASGVAFYSFYEFKKDSTERQVASFVGGFDKRFKTATDTIDADKTNAVAQIDKELEPLRKVQASGDTLKVLVDKLHGSLFFISTLDENGQASVGTGFVVASDSDQTLVLTSYATIRAATRQPAPAVRVRQGDADQKATLWTWDEKHDLALIILDRGNVPKLEFAPSDPAPRIGDRIFAVSALGAGGGAVTQGVVADVSASGLQHDAAVGQAWQGGPLVDSSGKVIGVASRGYAPLNFASDGVWFAPFARSACDRVLRCPSGGIGGAGDRSTPAPPPAPPTTAKPAPPPTTAKP